MNQLKLSQFDLYGTFRLKKHETTGIENLVQKLNDNEYLSRNGNYYPNVNHLDGLRFRGICDEYRRLNSMLPMNGKPAFVICEKMHELAIRVVNTIQQKNQMHLFQDGKHFDTVAQKCAQECADNLVRLMHGQTAVKTATDLRDETHLQPDDLLHDRSIIEADNKKQLYMCANALPDDTQHLITPGRGSSKLGTLVQAVRKHKGLKPLGITQIYYSLYSNKQGGKVFSQPLKHLPKKVLVMDDIIYRGSTLHRIKQALTQQGHHVTNGAITAAFYYHGEYDHEPVFKKSAWAHYIDIIPNQYASVNDQQNMRDCLVNQYTDGGEQLTDILNGFRNHDGQHTADYLAMRYAEEMAHEFGADLYQVSDKISPTAVAYNQKIRAQIEKYNAEFQDSLNI